MWRILVPVLFSLMPLMPAAAVVAIDAPARGVPAPTPAAQTPADTGLSFGEMAAALGGLMIFGIVAVGSRRHTVTA